MLHKRSVKEKLLKGGAWAFTGKVVIAIVGLAINALLARLLTPEEMGSYFLTFSLVSVAAIVAHLGLTQTIVRLVAESMGTDRPGRARQSVILVLRIVAFSGLIVTCFLAFGAGQWIANQLFDSEIMSQVMGLSAIWVVITTFQQLIAEVYRGFHDIRLATIFGGLATGVISMGIFLVLWQLQGHSDLYQIILVTTVAGFSSVVLSSLILWKKIKTLPLAPNSEIKALEIMRISLPLWVTNLTFFVLLQADLWIIGLFRAPEEVAVYGAAVRTVALVSMPLLLVNAIVPPLIAEMYAQKKTIELERALRSVATLAGFPSLLVLGVFIFSGDFILKSFFGDHYQTGWEVLVILSVGQAVNVLAGSCGLLLIMTKHQVEAMWLTLFSSIVGITTSLLLVGKYGPMGVAIGAAFGTTIHILSIVIYSNIKLNMRTYVYFRCSEIVFAFKRMGD